MDTLYENLLELCNMRGISGAKMCTDIGLSKSLMTGLKKGRRSSISMDTAQKIASYFNVSVGYLLGNEEEKEKSTTQADDGLTENHIKLIEIAKTLSEEDAALLLVALQAKQKR